MRGFSRHRARIVLSCVPILVVLVAFALLVTLSAIGTPPEPALACTGAPYDVNRADVIAEGWVDHVEISPTSSGSGQFHPVRVTMRVVRSLKGDAPSPLVFTDHSSYLPDPQGGPNGFWAGSSGACGVLDSDPTGQYALIVFERRDSELVTHLLLGAVFRDRPDDPTIGRFRQYLEGQLVPGAAPRVLAERPSWKDWLTTTRWPFLLAATLLATTFGTVGLLWGRERWRNA
jgi:hypothetical protein